jgi:hypothetical protein
MPQKKGIVVKKDLKRYILRMRSGEKWFRITPSCRPLKQQY